ncbi:hypothetical protein KIH24_13355 [Rhizobiales bacterium TNE-4]|nr:hypothetical protein [Rhizobiales bacterium TNE-4]MBV1828605.1 hypothetical protein [Rhizobiales bacterium TNE-4]
MLVRSESLDEFPLLMRIRDGELTPIGWGCGELFRLRRYIHDFDPIFTIHTSTNGIKIDDVDVFEPSILNSIDHKKYIIIFYTIDFLADALRYCADFPNLLKVPFNAAELGVAPHLKRLALASNILHPHGVSYSSTSQLLNELGYR